MSDITMEAEDLYQDPALAHFYDLSNGWGPDFDFCVAMAEGAQSVLDLGCGTGELAAHLGRTHDVVGVDPAEAMLAHARSREGGDRVDWVNGDARSIRLGRSFDLIVLTGHAFQVFLSDEDQLALLETIAAHLTPEGRFVFDSRNPLRQEWEQWRRKDRKTLMDPALGETEQWGGFAYDEASGIVTYETTYKVVKTGQTFHSPARIRFASQEHIAEQIAKAGLAANIWHGDWSGAPFTPDAKEIIPVGRLA